MPSPKTGINLRHPRPPQSLNDFAAMAGHHGPVYMRLSFPHPLLLVNLVSRDGLAVPSRVSLLISILRLNLVLTYGILPKFRGSVHLLI